MVNNVGHTWILWVSQTEHFYMILREIVDNQSYMPTRHIWLTYKSFVIHFWCSKSGYQNMIVYSFLFISIGPPKPLPLSPHTGLSHAQHKAARVKSSGPFFVFSASWDQGRFGFVSKWIWFGGIPGPLTVEFVKVFFGGPGHENEGKITISLASWVDYTPKIYSTSEYQLVTPKFLNQQQHKRSTTANDDRASWASKLMAS